MSSITKPILAATFDNDWEALRWPQYGTKKIDGVRSCHLKGKGLVSRTFKKIPNINIRTTLESFLPDGADGELVCGNFQETTHRVMSRDETSDGWKYCMFDLAPDITIPYLTRIENMKVWYETLTSEQKNLVELVLPTKLNDRCDVEKFETNCLSTGYEGVILRINGEYKCGRATLKQQLLTKIKRFMDSEALVLDIEELTINNNEATKDAFGRSERSSHKANLAPGGMLGTLCVKDITSNIEFRIGSGFSEDQRKYFWKHPEEIKNKIVKYKFFPTGCKDKPRHPIYLGVRDINDM